MLCMPDGPPNAKVMLVGEAPGEDEVAAGRPFVGRSGQLLNQLLSQAGIIRTSCFVTNVCRQRPLGNDIGNFVALKKKDITAAHTLHRDKYVLPPVLDGIALLRKELEMVQPNVVIAFGNLALWALTGRWGVGDWRGSEMVTDFEVNGRPIKVIPTYHPAYALRVYTECRTIVQDLRRAAKEAASPDVYTPNYSFIIAPNYSDTVGCLDSLFARAEAGPLPLAVDIETRAGHIACIGVGWSKSEAICIPLMCAGHASGYWPEEEESELMFRLRALLLHPNVEVIGQNFLYDAQYFWRWLHYVPRLRFDTMIAQHACYSTAQKGLDFLASMYCEHYVFWKHESKEWNAKKTGEETLWGYNCKDCVITFEVAESLRSLVAAMKLERVNEFQQSMFWPVLNAMIRGVRIDHSRRAAFAVELQAALADREQWFTDVLGHKLNPRSGKQMQALFYDDLRQKVVLNRKTGRPSLDDEALGKIAHREPLLRPLIDKISEYRSIGVFYSTFVAAPLDHDSRMRCSYNVAGTATYRFSSSENAFGSGTNLQNIPAGGEEASGLELPNVRKIFVPDEGMEMFDVDLAAADLRIVVWEADEREMKAMLAEGYDPYLEIAKEFYHDQSITKKDPRRQKFKSFAHGTHYLGTARGLAQRLGLTIHEAERTQKWYFQRFPAIKRWQDRFCAEVTAKRYVENRFGHRNYWFDRLDGTWLNKMIAWLPQSTVALIINQGWQRIEHEFKEAQVLLQTHDSLTGQYPRYLGDEARRRIIDLCSIRIPYDDPLTIPVGIKTSAVSWGDCA